MKNVLIRAPNWIGDQILAYPFFFFLRRAYPTARIVSACVPWVSSLQYRNLVDDVYELPVPKQKSWYTKASLLRETGRRLKSLGPWDLAITLPNSFSSAWLVYLAGAKVRRGYAMDGRGLLLTEKLSIASTKHLHRSESYLRLLPPVALPGDLRATEFWGIPPQDDLDPGKPGVVSAFDAAVAWPDAHPCDAPDEPYWVLAPGTQADSRRWPPQFYGRLATMIREQTGLRGYVIGGPADAPIATRLCDDRGSGLRDWTAKGPVTSYWKIFRQAKFTVANDSGLAHLASLCGSPVFIPWGAGDPKRTKPIGPGPVNAVLNPIDCWPCERNTCALPSDQKYACLRGILPESILMEVQAWIR